MTSRGGLITPVRILAIVSAIAALSVVFPVAGFAVGPSSVVISPDPVYLPADGVSQATLTALVKNSSGQPVKNVPVSWTINGGASVAPAATVTNANGIATTVVTAGPGWGAKTVTANAVTASDTSTVVEYGSPSRAMITLSPALIPADGSSTSTATVTVTDSNDPPDPIPTATVTVTTNGPSTVGPVTNNGNGTYAAPVTSSTTPSLETITATAARGSVQVTGSAQLTAFGPARRVDVTSSRPSIPATGRPQPAPVALHLNDPNGWEPEPYIAEPAMPTVTATVTDVNGGRVPNETIAFTTNGDVTFGAVANNGNGTYTASVTSSTTPGLETITARATLANVSGQAPLRETFGLLHTAPGDTRILDTLGNEVILRGIQLSPERDPYLVHRYFLPRVYDNARDDWRVNVMRAFIELDEWTQACPVRQQQGKYDPDYKKFFQAYVRGATQRGMFVILTLAANPRILCDPQDARNTPRADDYNHRRMAARDAVNAANDSAHFWADVALTFKDNPLVGFDLYNEPYDITNDQWLNGGAITGDSFAWVAAGMQEMYNAIRATGATNLVFVEGPSWANTPPSNLISSAASATHGSDRPATNIVYTFHYYTCPGVNEDGTPNCGGITPPQPDDPCDLSPTPAWQNVAPVLQRWVDFSNANGVPIMENEFGWPSNNDPVDRCFMQSTIDFNESHHVSWSAFHWVGWPGEAWGLTKAFDSGDFSPTISGAVVKAALLNNQI